MENTTGDASKASPEGVSATTEAQVSSPETVSVQDLTKNLKAEMNRKFSKMNEQLSKIASFVEQTQRVAPVGKTEVAPEPKFVDKSYVDSVLFEKEALKAVAVHNEQFEEAKKALPELDEESDQYDPDFFKTVDRYYIKLKKADPTDANAFRDALELASTKTGKTERLVKEKILKDEARRSRLIAEGSSVPRDSKKEKDSIKFSDEQKARLQRKLGINPDKLEARIKKGQ